MTPQQSLGFPVTDKIAERFVVFHEQQPQVYKRLRVMALSLRRRGWRRYGIAALFEVVRYESSIATRGADGLKLNNNYAALYARLLEQSEPELVGFFSKRERRPRGIDGQITEAGDMPAPPVDRFDRPLGATL